MISGFFTSFGDIGSGIMSFIKSFFEGVISLFYTAGTDGAFGSFTFLGVCLLSASAIGLFYVVFRFVKSLIKLK